MKQNLFFDSNSDEPIVRVNRIVKGNPSRTRQITLESSDHNDSQEFTLEDLDFANIASVPGLEQYGFLVARSASADGEKEQKGVNRYKTN
jgi:hypothetical protein